MSSVVADGSVRADTSGTDVDRLSDLAHSPHQHFTLYFYAALLRVLDQASRHLGSPEAANERFPFLAGYFAEIAARGLEHATFAEAHGLWRDAVVAWERAARCWLPLAALRAAVGLDHDDLTILAQIGLPDEDSRFGLLFDAIQGGGGERRATLGLLGAGWPTNGKDDPRRSARRLQALGLVEPSAGEGLGLRPCAVVWDAVRGSSDVASGDWVRHRPRHTLPELESLILPAALRAACLQLATAFSSGPHGAVVLRGPRHNGRGTLAAALAKHLGKSLLEVSKIEGPRDPRWSSVAALGCMLDAALLIRAEPAPAEVFELPDIPEALASVFVVVGSAGAVSGNLSDRAITLELPIPDARARTALWRLSGIGTTAMEGSRITSGNIIRAARVLQATHRVTERAVDSLAVRAAIRSLEGPGLEAHATRLEPADDWSRVAVSPETLTDLVALAARCRQREQLGAFAGKAFEQLGPGVRALFKGPSGSGKTLAARTLAGVLGMDLWSIQLASIVSRYVGDSTKSLERVFACAEELDIILLLDEGDALLTRRTAVENSTDKYANLETNYLLQRLESYAGIIVVTTNAPDRIDAAFQRRMDVVIDFALPDAGERLAIWQLHLPPDHEVGLDQLHTVAQRCVLSGGQIRNVALHASLLALEGHARVGGAHLEAAIEREYRKLGAMSPVRTRNGTA